MKFKPIQFKFIFLLALLCLFVSPVFATTYPSGFSPVIEYNNTELVYGLQSTDFVHYNMSFTRDDNGSTPFILWLFVAVIGLALLIASFVLTTGQGAELIALIAPYPLLVTAWQSLAIDMITGFGVTSQVEWVGNGSILFQKDAMPNINEYVLLENHVIYSEVLLAVFFLILFIVSLLNIYRLYLKAKTIEDDGDRSNMRRV